MLYMVTFTINIPPMLVYIPYMDPMGVKKTCVCHHLLRISKFNIFQHISTSHSLPEVPLLIAQLAHGPEEAAQLLLSTSQYRLSRPAEGHQQRHIAPG